MATKWYYKLSGQAIGPLSAAELRQHVLDGKLTTEAYVRRTDIDRWVPADKVKGLLGPPSTPAPSPSKHSFLSVSEDTHRVVESTVSADRYSDKTEEVTRRSFSELVALLCAWCLILLITPLVVAIVNFSSMPPISALDVCARVVFFGVIGICMWFFGKSMMQQAVNTPGVGFVYGPIAYLLPLIAIGIGAITVYLPILIIGNVARAFGFHLTETTMTMPNGKSIALFGIAAKLNRPTIKSRHVATKAVRENEREVSSFLNSLGDESDQRTGGA